MNSFFLLFIGLPILEIFLMIKIGGKIGALNTIALIFLTAVIGVYFAKLQGIQTLKSGMINLYQYKVKELVDVIKNVSINTPSAPTLTQFGYHIIWVDEKIDGGPANLDKNWLDLEQMALNQKKSDWYSNWIKEIKNKFYIKRNPLTYPQIKN